MNKESQFYQVLVKIENGIKRMSEQAAAVRWYLEADDLDTAYDKAKIYHGAGRGHHVQPLHPF